MASFDSFLSLYLCLTLYSVDVSSGAVDSSSLAAFLARSRERRDSGSTDMSIGRQRDLRQTRQPR